MNQTTNPGRLSYHHIQTALGAAAWLAVVATVWPSPFATGWAHALLLLAPLVIVPITFRLVSEGDGAEHTTLTGIIVIVHFPASLLFALAYVMPQGMPAALLAIPWLALTGLIGLYGLVRLRRHGLSSAHELAVSAGCIYLPIGAAWAVLDRFGLRPLHFEPVIVLLTAIHFHYAGFLLPIMTGFAAKRFPSSKVSAWSAAVGVTGAVPLVAIGITATQLGWSRWFETVAAWSLASAGLLTAWLHFRLACGPHAGWLVRGLWLAAATSLTFSMVLAILYGSRLVLDVSWLDIPWMRALHGSANALGFGLGGILAWASADWPPPANSGRSNPANARRRRRGTGVFF